ncbi:uncharacterized protein SCHCODRAFT_02686620 [Schizophyllum commune H4-8]|uniref:uncharacterized protein n=1 Tax=Schizophyllum commune (strain H4-8 / FGSC 9210) TaxID=578458 RepID=UPI0021609833|nr:uncharacterized protein SCHCODRAFT_02686620 [Schizophyllum commune H4-8]KAI5895191.1 hypothetical protein SCHCODRAFT_02686620 [Schizophyllum commune H4-8]
MLLHHLWQDLWHCVATIPTNYKVVTTTVCCNILHYWPVGHCRAGRHRRRRHRNPAATVRDALVVVAPPPAPRRAPTCCPPRPPILPTRLPTRHPAVHRPDARSRRLSHAPLAVLTVARARPRGRTCIRERGARNRALGRCRERTHCPRARSISAWNAHPAALGRNRQRAPAVGLRICGECRIPARPSGSVGIGRRAHASARSTECAGTPTSRDTHPRR